MQEALAEVADQLTAAMRSVGDRVLSCSIVSRVTKSLRLPRNRIGAAVACLAIGIVVAAFAVSVNWLVGYPMSRREYFTISAASLFTGFAFYVVKSLYEAVLPPNIEALRGFVKDEAGKADVAAWFRESFNAPRQILTSLAVSIFSVATLIAFSLDMPRLIENTGLFIATAFGMFAVGNGAYCAVVIPTLAASLARHRVSVFEYYPAASRQLRIASGIFTTLSAGNSVVVTCLMLGLFLLNPWSGRTTVPIAIAWLVVAWGIVTYSFIFPNFMLIKAATAEKKNRLDEIEAAVRVYDGRFHDLTKDDLTRLSQLLDLHKRTLAGRVSPIDVEAWRIYVSSLVLPTLSFVVGFLLKR